MFQLRGPDAAAIAFGFPRCFLPPAAGRARWGAGVSHRRPRREVGARSPVGCSFRYRGSRTRTGPRFPRPALLMPPTPSRSCGVSSPGSPLPRVLHPVRAAERFLCVTSLPASIPSSSGWSSPRGPYTVSLGLSSYGTRSLQFSPLVHKTKYSVQSVERQLLYVTISFNKNVGVVGLPLR